MASSRTNRPRVNITGIGIYRSGFSKYFTINPLKLSGETIQLPNTNYGNESVTTYLRNNLIITYNGTKLTSDDFTITSVRCSASNEILDFSLSYKQNYSGTRQMTSVKLCNFSNIPEQIFKGAAVTPKPTASEINGTGHKDFHFMERLHITLESCKECSELYSLQKNKFGKIHKT